MDTNPAKKSSQKGAFHDCKRPPTTSYSDGKPTAPVIENLKIKMQNWGDPNFRHLPSVFCLSTSYRYDIRDTIHEPRALCIEHQASTNPNKTPIDKKSLDFLKGRFYHYSNRVGTSSDDIRYTNPPSADKLKRPNMSDKLRGTNFYGFFNHNIRPTNR